MLSFVKISLLKSIIVKFLDISKDQVITYPGLFTPKQSMCFFKQKLIHNSSMPISLVAIFFVIDYKDMYAKSSWIQWTTYSRGLWSSPPLWIELYIVVE